MKKDKVQRPRDYQKHFLTPVLKTLKRGGLSAIDQRSALAKETVRLRRELLRDLGGEENLSVQQLKLVQEFIKRSIMVESIDGWLFSQPTLINRRTKALWPIVAQRQVIADGMIRCLERLGLDRKSKPVQDLQDYLRQKETDQK